MTTTATQEARHLILYDGVCGLCDRWVQQILARDPAGLFHFASLQSAIGHSLLLQYGKNPNHLDTIYVVVDYKSESPRILDRSKAALFVIGQLASPWRFLRVFNALPSFLPDAVYALIARNRYRLFGKFDQCVIPKPEQASRFIDL